MVRTNTQIRTVGDFLRWELLLRDDLRAELQQYPTPKEYKGKVVPENLNSLTFEELIAVSDTTTSEEFFVRFNLVLFGLTADKVRRAPFAPQMGIANMVSRELKRILGLWQSASGEPDANDIIAGVENLQFGWFGIADWYAQRMGITNHDEVFSTPWIRIWQCMYNDHQTQEFQKRKQALIASQLKR